MRSRGRRLCNVVFKAFSTRVLPVDNFPRIALIDAPHDPLGSVRALLVVGDLRSGPATIGNRDRSSSEVVGAAVGCGHGELDHVRTANLTTRKRVCRCRVGIANGNLDVSVRGRSGSLMPRRRQPGRIRDPDLDRNAVGIGFIEARTGNFEGAARLIWMIDCGDSYFSVGLQPASTSDAPVSIAKARIR